MSDVAVSMARCIVCPLLTICQQTGAGQRIAATLNAMLASLQFVTPQGIVEQSPDRASSSRNWMPVLPTSRFKGAIGTPVGYLNDQGHLPPAQVRIIPHGPDQVRHFQQAGHHPCRLPQRQLEEDLDRQANWTAASENAAGRPGAPSCGAIQVMSLSSQTCKEP